MVTVVPNSDIGEDASRQFTSFADGLDASADFSRFVDQSDRQRTMAPNQEVPPPTEQSPDGLSAPALAPDAESPATMPEAPASPESAAAPVPQLPPVPIGPAGDQSPQNANMATASSPQVQPIPQAAPTPAPHDEVAATAKAVQAGAAPAALTWARQNMGSQAYVDLCEKFIENAYGQNGQFPSALAAANAYKAQGQLRTDFENAKPGNRVFYGAHPENGGYGHAALLNDQGSVVSSASPQPTPLQGYFRGPLLGYVPGSDNGMPAPSDGSGSGTWDTAGAPSPDARGAMIDANRPADAQPLDPQSAVQNFLDFTQSLAGRAGAALNNTSLEDVQQALKRGAGGPLKALEEAGLGLSPLSDEQRQAFRDAAEPAVNDFAEQNFAAARQRIADIGSTDPERQSSAIADVLLSTLKPGGDVGPLGNNIRVGRLPEDVGPAIEKTYQEGASAIDAARRGVIPDAQAVENARDLAKASGMSVDDLVTRWKPGDAANEETLIALRNGLVDRQRAAQAAQSAWAVDASPGNFSQYQDAKAAADNMQTVVHGLTAEAGRALRAMGIDVTDPLVLGQMADSPEIRAALQSGFKPGGLPEGIVGKFRAEHPNLGMDATPQAQDMIPGLEPPAIGQKTLDYSTKPFTAEAGSGADVTAAANAGQIGKASFLDRSALPGLGASALNAGMSPEEAAAATAATRGQGVVHTWRERGEAITTATGKAVDAIQSYRYSSLLSDPMTHMVNIGGNAATTLTAPLEDLASLRPGVAGARAFGTIRAIGEAVPDALKVLAQGTNYGREGVSEGLAGGLKNPLNYPGRALGAMDALFGGINTRAEAYAQAAQQATKKGLTAGTSEWRQAVDRYVTDQSPKMYEATQGAKTYRTFQDAMTDWESNLEAVARTGAGKWIMPFFRTPWNMAKYELERSPFGAVNVAKNLVKGDVDAARTAAGRTIAGSALTFGLTQLADQGLITGPLPTDRTEADRWRREGIQPNSILVGGKWIDYRLTGPFTVNFASAAAISKAMKEGKTPWETAAITAGSATRAMVDLPFLRGVSDIYDALQGRMEDATAVQKVTRILDSYARSAAPMAGFWHFIARATDRTLRDPSNPIESVYAELPGASQFVEPRLDAFGKPLQRPEDQSGLNALNPLRPDTPIADPVEDKIKQLSAYGLKASPGFVGKSTTIYGQDAKLSDSSQRQYQEASGQLAYNQIATQLIGTPAFENKPPAQQAAQVRQIVDDARAAVRDQMQEQWAKEAGITAAFSKGGPKYYGVDDAAQERKIDSAVSKVNTWLADPKSTPKPDDETLKLGYTYKKASMQRYDYRAAQKATTAESRQIKGGVQSAAQQFVAP